MGIPQEAERRLGIELTVLVALVIACTVPAQPVAAEEPEFPHGEFAGECETCHPDEGWRPVVVSADFRREVHPFPLQQAHDLPDCRACHRNLDFTLADPACVSCHTDPHRGELGIDCARCHTPRNFIDRTRMQRDHQLTRFPLRGTHRALECEDCHGLTASGKLRFVNTPVDCVACHRRAFEAAQDPDHGGQGFSRECDLCHVPTVWEQGRFNHALVSESCVTCHLADYEATRDPDHQAAGFGTDCESCHTPTRWQNAQFDHDSILFPIYSGRHRGLWDSCSTCHVSPGNFNVFSCFGCHPHSDESATREDHEDVLGFRYASDACYACHPRGRAED